MHALTSNTKNAIPLVAIDAKGYPAWLRKLPARERDWLTAAGFEAATGKFMLVPGAYGKPMKVVVGADFSTDPIWSLAGLSDALPAGIYKLDARLTADTATQVALGWELGAYRFTRYKSAPRKPAELVWPGECDRKEVEHLARAIYLARDLINTPCEDLGPPDLAAAAKKVADEFGARFKLISGELLLKHNYPTIHAVGRASAVRPA